MNVLRWIAVAGLVAAVSGPASAAMIVNEADFLAQTTTTIQNFSSFAPGSTEATAAASQSFTNPDFTFSDADNTSALAVNTRTHFNASNPDNNRVLGYNRVPSGSNPNPSLSLTVPPGTAAVGFTLESVLRNAQQQSGVLLIVSRNGSEIADFFFEHGESLFFGLIDPVGLDPLTLWFYDASSINRRTITGLPVLILIDDVQVGGLRGDPSVIPLPAAFPLLGGAMGILGFIGWRRRRALNG